MIGYIHLTEHSGLTWCFDNHSAINVGHNCSQLRQKEIVFGIHDSIHYKLSELVTNTVTTHGFKASSYIYRKLCFVAVWRAKSFKCQCDDSIFTDEWRSMTTFVLYCITMYNTAYVLQISHIMQLSVQSEVLKCQLTDPVQHAYTYLINLAHYIGCTSGGCAGHLLTRRWAGRS